MGLLLELDPHSAYLDVEEHTKLQESATGQYGGLGIEISTKRGLLEVIAPIDDSPAQKAGIRTGDFIHEINGEPVRSFALPEAIDKLRGPKGSSIDLSILREGEDNPIFFKQKTAYEIGVRLVGSEMCIRDSSRSCRSVTSSTLPLRTCSKT